MQVDINELSGVRIKTHKAPTLFDIKRVAEEMGLLDSAEIDGKYPGVLTIGDFNGKVMRVDLINGIVEDVLSKLDIPALNEK